LLRDKITDAARLSQVKTSIVKQTLHTVAQDTHENGHENPDTLARAFSLSSATNGPSSSYAGEDSRLFTKQYSQLSLHAIEWYDSHIPDCPSGPLCASDVCSYLVNQLTKCQKHKTVDGGLKQARLKQHDQQRTVNDGLIEACLKQHARQSRPHTAC